MKILISGFDPFGGESVNPAYEAIKLLPKTIAGAEVIGIEVPTVFGKGPAKVAEAIAKFSPDAVMCVGQAGGRCGITIEKVGINFKNARIPDNEGNQPINEPIKVDGEVAYFTTLPAFDMVDNIRAHNIPASISYSAGTYVCNDMLYTVLDYLNENCPSVKGGFIHVPFSTEQVLDKPTGPSLPIETIAKGLECCVETIVKSLK